MNGDFVRRQPARLQIVKEGHPPIIRDGVITGGFITADDDDPDGYGPAPTSAAHQGVVRAEFEFTSGLSPEVWELVTGQPWPGTPLWKRLWRSLVRRWKNWGGA